MSAGDSILSKAYRGLTMDNRSVLPALLKEAVLAVITLAEKQNLGPELPTNRYEVMWMQPMDESSSSGMREERTEPSIQLLWSTLEADLKATPEVQDLNSAVEDITQEYGVSIKGMPGFLRGYQSERLLQVYFERVGALLLDEGTVTQVCRDYLEDLQAPDAVVAIFFLVENFSAPSLFHLTDEIQFRPVSPDDIDSFGREPISFFPRTRPVLNLKDWVCEVHTVGSKDTAGAFDRHNDLVDEIAVALNLTKEGRVIFTLLANYYQSPFYDAGTVSGGQAVPTGGIGGKITLDSSDIKVFESSFRAVQSIMAGTKQRGLRLPLRRLQAAARRRESEDRLVDYVIGLERLLANDSPQLETTFRFRLRGAALLPESFGSPRQRIALMNRLYGALSDVVHGKAKESEVGELLPKAENVLRTVLLWYIHNKPTHWTIPRVIQDLDDALVSGGSSWASQDI